jgi:hypothetical protein
MLNDSNQYGQWIIIVNLPHCQLCPHRPHKATISVLPPSGFNWNEKLY